MKNKYPRVVRHGGPVHASGDPGRCGGCAADLAADRAAANENQNTAKTPEESNMTTISDLQERAYRQSADKGFHDNEPTDPRAVLSLNAERIALMHSELSEALEELRAGKAANETHYSLPGIHGTYPSAAHAKATHHGPEVNPKPEGVPSEMADVVIRILDFCGANEINLESIILEKLDYNASRGRMHGGKKF